MRCGFYETEITPPLGTTIFGHCERRVNVGVRDKLYSKACVLEHNGKYCAMLVMDSLTVPASFPAFIRQYVHEKTGIDPNALLITATHAHTAFPYTGDSGIHKAPNVMENEPELNPALDKQTLDMIRLLSASVRVIEYYGQDPDAVFDVPVQVVKIGSCLIWALPGEVFCQFADKLRSASPTQNNMFVELANHTDHPYIPTREMFLPYVYESSYYSSRFAPDAGDLMTDKAIVLAHTLFIK